MLAVDARVFWDSFLAACAPVLLTFLIARSERFKAWRAARHAHKEQIQAMAEKWQSFEAGIQKHFDDNDAARGRSTAQFKAIDDRLAAQDKALATILSMTMGQFEMSAAPSFVCETDGKNTNVNAAYAALLGVGRDDLMDYRYKRFIPPDVLTMHMALFEAANLDHREFENEIVMLKADRTPLRVRVHMIPYPRDIGPATHWVGTITLVPEAKP